MLILIDVSPCPNLPFYQTSPYPVNPQKTEGHRPKSIRERAPENGGNSFTTLSPLQ